MYVKDPSDRLSADEMLEMIKENVSEEEIKRWEEEEDLKNKIEIYKELLVEEEEKKKEEENRLQKLKEEEERKEKEAKEQMELLKTIENEKLAQKELEKQAEKKKSEEKERLKRERNETLKKINQKVYEKEGELHDVQMELFVKKCKGCSKTCLPVTVLVILLLGMIALSILLTILKPVGISIVPFFVASGFYFIWLIIFAFWRKFFFFYIYFFFFV
jgi:hypothetical protein